MSGSQARTKILILEDSLDYQHLYASVLGDAYAVRFLDAVAAFKDYLARGDERPDLVISDILLADGSMLALLDQPAWYARFQDWPTLYVTVVDELAAIERLIGNQRHDYIHKPFSRNELLAKCRRLLQAPAASWTYCPVSSTILRGARRSPPLTAYESRILNALRTAPDGSLERQELVRHVWDEARVSKKLYVHLVHLRRKLKTVCMSVDASGRGVISLREHDL